MNLLMENMLYTLHILYSVNNYIADGAPTIQLFSMPEVFFVEGESEVPWKDISWQQQRQVREKCTYCEHTFSTNVSQKRHERNLQKRSTNVTFVPSNLTQNIVSRDSSDQSMAKDWSANVVALRLHLDSLKEQKERCNPTEATVFQCKDCQSEFALNTHKASKHEGKT